MCQRVEITQRAPTILGKALPSVVLVPLLIFGTPATPAVPQATSEGLACRVQRLANENPVVVVVARDHRQRSGHLHGIKVAFLLFAHLFSRRFLIRRLCGDRKRYGIRIEIAIRIIAHKAEGMQKFDLLVFADVEIGKGSFQDTQHDVPGMFVGVGIGNTLGGDADFDAVATREMKANTVAELSSSRFLNLARSGT